LCGPRGRRGLGSRRRCGQHRHQSRDPDGAKTNRHNAEPGRKGDTAGRGRKKESGALVVYSDVAGRLEDRRVAKAIAGDPANMRGTACLMLAACRHVRETDTRLFGRAPANRTRPSAGQQVAPKASQLDDIGDVCRLVHVGVRNQIGHHQTDGNSTAQASRHLA